MLFARLPSATFALLLLFTFSFGEDEVPEGVPPPQETQEETKVTYNGAQVIRLPSSFKEILQPFEDESDVEMWAGNSTCAEYFVGQKSLMKVKEALDKEKAPYKILIEDLQRAIDEENPVEETDDELVGRKDRSGWRWRPPYYFSQLFPSSFYKSRPGHRMSWESYHRLDDIYGYLDYLAQTYPDLVSVGTVGNSVEGRPLKYVKISSGKPNAKSFWIDGGIHAREWISPATAAYIINEFVENRDSHKSIVDNMDFYILPVLNPDGYEYTHTRERLWRKNRSKNYYFCPGTDLNRNWGYKWGGKGTSKENCKEIYRGSGPFSEPETRAVSNFILANNANMKAFVTFHSYGQYILIPFGYDYNSYPSDFADLERVGRKAAQAIRQTTGAHYTVGNSAKTLYPASGGADDWAKGSAKVKYSYTIELRDRGQYGFVLPASYIIPTAKEALAAIKVIAAEAQVAV